MLQQFSRLTLLSLVVAFVSPVFGANTHTPDERDRQVLETTLLNLLADPDFHMTRVAAKGSVIVLHTRTPEGTGFLRSGQMRHDIGDHSLPSDAEEDLRRRNTVANVEPDAYVAIAAFYTDLKFSAPIMVADLTDNTDYIMFVKAYPKARGFAWAYLPGYSKDGTRAVVRADVGPSPHGSTVTALLENLGGKWVVTWHYIAFYV